MAEGRRNHTGTAFLTMLEKKGTSIDLIDPITRFVRSQFSDRQALDAADDLTKVQQLRADLLSASQPLEQRKETLFKYFRALCAMETRFPISGDKEHVRLSFAWCDAFKPQKKATQSNIHFEKAAVLYNLAAVQCQQAVAADRSSDDGIKLACHLFQMAAGACAHLRDAVGLKVSPGATVDIGKECCNLLVWLMLAQAQECAHIKAVADNKSPGILAKLAKQAGSYYQEAYKAVTAGSLSGHFDKTWVTHVSIKAATFAADAYFRAALAHKAEEKIGCELSRLKQAVAKLQEVRRAKPPPCPALEAMSALEALVLVEQNIATKDNQCVYMEPIPNPDTLPPLTGHSLVKPLAPGDILDPKGGDKLFQSIVPDSSTKALSKYTDMVDNLCRTQGDALMAMEEQVKQQLGSLQLPDLVRAAEGHGSSCKLPESVRTLVDELQSKGGATQVLQDMVQQQLLLRNATAEMLMQAVRVLDDEAGEDARERAKHGGSWNRPESATLAAPMRERLETYRQNLTQAEESDRSLAGRVGESADMFSHLHPDRIGMLLPPLQAPMSVVDDSPAPTTLAALKATLAKLEKTSSERLALDQTIKQIHQGDNILGKVMAAPESYDALFQAELGKYTPAVQRVQQNVESTRALLAQLTDEQKTFCAAFQVDAWRTECDHAMGNVRGLVEQYKLLADNLQDGIVFYTNLQDAINGVMCECQDYAMSRSLQQTDMRGAMAAEEQRRQTAEQDRAAAERLAREQQAAQAAQAQLASMSLRSQTLPPVHFQQPTYSHPPPSYSAPPPPQQQHQPPQSQYGGWAQYGGGVQQPNYSQPPPPAYDPHTAPGAQPMYDPHTAPGAQPAPAYYHSPPTNTQYYQQPPPQQQQPYGYGGQSTYPQYQYPPQ